MKVRERSDPRLEGLFGLEPDPEGGVRPIVPLARKGVPAWMLGLIGLSLAILLFVALEARRISVPSESRASPRAEISAQPPAELYIPPAAPQVFAPPAVVPVTRPISPPPLINPPMFMQSPRDVTAARASVPVPETASIPQGKYGGSSPNALVVDYGSVQAATAAEDASRGRGPIAPFGSGSRSGARVQSSTLANRGSTIAQGTVIPAVLETAFNSSQPGYARAMVSRHIRGFDGSRILIPRGSRLVGEYGNNASPGQNRAVIMWTRLIRPDGVTMALNSPAADPLGRAGVRAKVNNHLFERFTGAVFESIFNLGSNVVGGRNRGVVVALPGGAGTSSTSTGREIMPTLSVPAGMSISVFVVHDLEFSDDGVTP